jgi:hypothetical protein
MGIVNKYIYATKTINRYTYGRNEGTKNEKQKQCHNIWLYNLKKKKKKHEFLLKKSFFSVQTKFLMQFKHM